MTMTLALFFLSNTAEERVEVLGIFMLNRSFALGLNGPWAASGEDSSVD